MRPMPRLLGIADPSALDDAAYLDGLETALASNLRMVVFRAKHLPPRRQWELGRKVAALCAAYGVKMLVSDRADLAVALGADGVHLPANGLPVHAARRCCTDHLVGVSCHSLQDVFDADDEGADYVILSPIFEVQDKPGYGPALGTEALATVCRRVGIRVFALGGVNPERVGSCVEAGAWGVAAMTGIFRGDVSENVHSFLSAL